MTRAAGVNTEFRAFSSRALRRIVALETIGFVVAIVACWVTEWLDPPFNPVQAAVMSALIAGLGAATVYWTSRIVRRITFLEGFLVICAGCKRLRVDEHWEPIDAFLQRHSDLALSHGMCPACIERWYGPELRAGPPVR
jgi:hypothetical protein